MNTQVRFYRVVVAAAFGAVLWAACSSPPETHPAPQARRVGSGPVDLLRTTADTHPEYRVGMTSFDSRPFQTVLPGGGTTPIVRVVDHRRVQGQNTIITESAGAQQDSAKMQSYEKELGARALQGDPQ